MEAEESKEWGEEFSANVDAKVCTFLATQYIKHVLTVNLIPNKV